MAFSVGVPQFGETETKDSVAAIWSRQTERNALECSGMEDPASCICS